MAVVELFPNRSYSWRCDDCGAERKEYPHRGPHKSVCKRCQNIRYRAGRSAEQVTSERAAAARHSREYRTRRRGNGWEAW